MFTLSPTRSLMRPFASLLLLCLAGSPALAGWSLDPARSHLAFVSIKAKDLGEVHHFTEMSGRIDPEGQVRVAMLLDSVETLIPIRNMRMREMLFETTNYKEARLTAKIDPALIAAMTPGEIVDVSAEGVLSLHGQEQAMTLEMQAAMVSEDRIMVASTKPLIVDAAKFGLTDGVEKLRDIVGLSSISHAVPVSFVITFIDTPETSGQ